MRLINVNTYALSEFLESDVPPYAILSHTWGPDEVSYQDMQKLRHAKKKAGFAKIAWACLEGSLAAIQWAWVDTCCIDKTSSAELQEAINSMYRWYAEAQVCYAYLGDVSRMDWMVNDHSSLRRSKWFTRGWTLQELIAPQDVRFYGQDWFMLFEGSHMVFLLSDITKVDVAVLRHETRLSSISIAKRMSWAAYRQTSRTEDMAYCLLGLFEVSIPMLYGEGKRSFRRLQEEIIRTSNDHSIFAWGLNLDRTTSDLLASSPADFQGGHEIVSWGRPGQYEMTNRGLRINLPILQQETPAVPVPWSAEYEEQEYLGILNCRREHNMDSTIALRMQKFRDEEEFIVSSGRKANTRLLPISLESVLTLQPSLIGIAREFQAKESPVKFWFRLPDPSTTYNRYEVSARYPEHCWTGSVMHPRPFSSRATALDDNSDIKAGRSETVVEAGVAVRLHSPSSAISEEAYRVVFSFGYHLEQQKPTLEENLAMAEKFSVIPSMAVMIDNTQSLESICATSLRCVNCPHEHTSSVQTSPESCPHNLSPRKIKLQTAHGQIWQLSMAMRERSIMGETTFVIDASISQHVELDGVMVPAELEAIEWTGREPMYNKHEMDSYAYTSRMGAWQEAQELQRDTVDIYGSFALLVSNMMAINVYSWDDIMGDKDWVELEATEWHGNAITDSTLKRPSAFSMSLVRKSEVQYIIDAWQVQEDLNDDVATMFGSMLCIPVTYLTSMMPLTTVDQELEMHIYRSLAGRDVWQTLEVDELAEGS